MLLSIQGNGNEGSYVQVDVIPRGLGKGYYPLALALRSLVYDIAFSRWLFDPRVTPRYPDSGLHPRIAQRETSHNLFNGSRCLTVCFVYANKDKGSSYHKLRVGGQAYNSKYCYLVLQPPKLNLIHHLQFKASLCSCSLIV